MLNFDKHRTKNFERKYRTFYLVKIDGTWTPVRGILIGPWNCVAQILVYLNEDKKKRMALRSDWKYVKYSELTRKYTEKGVSFARGTFEHAIESAADLNVRTLKDKFFIEKNKEELANTDVAQEIVWTDLPEDNTWIFDDLPFDDVTDEQTT